MTFLEHKQRAAQRLNLIDSNGSFLAGRDITESDIGNAINEARDTVIAELANQYPFLFEVTSYAANYTSTSTVSSVTTTTLIVNDSIFTIASEGCNVYNSTRTEYAKIKTYTSGTTVTLETDESATWVATDVIYLLDKEYTFAGDATDYISSLSIKARYGTTDEYVEASQRLYDIGNEDISSTSAPVYTLKQIPITSSDPVQGFEIYPLFEVADSRALYVRYIQLPGAMTDSTDPTLLPDGFDGFLYWKAVEYGAIQRKDEVLAAYSKAEFDKGRLRLLSLFKPLRGKEEQRGFKSHLTSILKRDY